MTPKTYEEEKRLAEQLKFDLDMFRAVSCDTACRICNGIGPEAFPAPFIRAINALHPSLVIVADNHDIGYYYGSGTASDFAECNRAFYANGVKIARHKYKWYDPRRYLVIFAAWRYSRLCQTTFGWAAYTAAIRKRRADRQP